MANYSFEKGKYGGPCGAIFPFFREISGALPIDQDYLDYIPAGFLKCRGQILQADQFPNLARVLGVGANCIYRKSGTLLQEADDDGTGGTFQLPDLGSKYISASANSGSYNDDTALNPVINAQVPRAGVEITLETSGSTAEFTYTGSFRHPGIASLQFSGVWRNVSPPGRTPNATVSVSDFLAHGHTSDCTIARGINIRRDGLGTVTYSGRGFGGGICCGSNGTACSPNGNAGVIFVFNDAVEEGEEAAHNHPVPPPVVSQTVFGSIPATNLSASSLTTTVTVNKRNIFKADDVAPKFIICEFLIKF